MTEPTLLCLDFDGVICDGLPEYFQSAWQAYNRIWQPDSAQPPADLAPRFHRLRPVVETGWEMPVLLHALQMQIAEAEIWANWSAISTQLIAEADLRPQDIGPIVDEIRDHWIATDLPDWLSHHQFYPGVLDRLKAVLQSPTQLVIISTKEGRFIQELLQQQGIRLADDQIYGKEVKRPKFETLRMLQAAGNGDAIWFIEDRLKTLQLVDQQSDLGMVQLFLADWGYNTPTDRQTAKVTDRISLLSLAQFSQPFSIW